MSYLKWFDAHAKKHKQIVTKLSHLSDNGIIEYFDFENMVINEPDYCPLYATNQKCHDTKKLNCYLCACPNFRFCDEGFEKNGLQTVLSYCAIESEDGCLFETDTAIHQDCSNCLVPHSKEYIKKHFSRDWLKCMDKVQN